MAGHWASPLRALTRWNIGILQKRIASNNRHVLLGRFATSKPLQRHLTSKNLSRTERRILERKERNKQKRIQAQEGKDASKIKEEAAAPFPKLATQLRRVFHPRVPGTGAPLTRSHLQSLAYRLPWIFALCFLATNEDTSPYVVQASLGPSMLPTIQFIGDLWLVETSAWYRAMGWSPTIQRGDVVLWKDKKTGRVSCKRIVGLEGDRVLRYGQYAHLYKNRDDWGIVWPKDAKAREFDVDCAWDSANLQKDLNRKLVVPVGEVWLEGDCPPFSLDSRHYGPVPVSQICGRLVLRVWPLQREDDDGNTIPKRVEKVRPTPFPTAEQYLGKRFNFYRLKKE